MLPQGAFEEHVIAEAVCTPPELLDQPKAFWLGTVGNAGAILKLVRLRAPNDALLRL